MSDPTGAYLPPNDYLRFTITGANLKRMATRDYWWEGPATTSTITLSGQMSAAVAQNMVSYVGMSASIGSKTTWKWPPTGVSNEVRNQTVTQNFNLTYKIAADTPDPLQVRVSLSMCGGTCAGYTAVFWIHPGKSPTTGTTQTGKPLAPRPAAWKIDAAIAWAKKQAKSATGRWASYCQGFVQAAYGGTSHCQSAIDFASAAGLHRGDPIESVPRGALIYFGRGASKYGHAGISLGGGKMIHALATVVITDLSKSRSWKAKYIGWTWPPAAWPGRKP